ncbi:MAG TPA: hypothetical protein DCF45_12775 [Gammaproteobacteria bacterium]|nr:hypothetical protein [Gammaproteobacteria bacterium]
MSKIVLLSRHYIEDAVCSSTTRLFLCFLLIAIMGGEFVARLGIIEQEVFRISLQAFSLRLVAVMFIAAQVSASYSEQSRNGQLQVLMATEVSRSQYLAGRAVGLACYAFFLSSAVALSLAFWVFEPALLVWAAGLFLELLVVGLFTLFVVITYQTVAVAMILTAAFYLLARLIEPLTLMAGNPAVGLTGDLLVALRSILPDLGRFNQVDWLVYGVDEGVSSLATGLEGVLFGLLVYCAVHIDFRRRQL